MKQTINLYTHLDRDEVLPVSAQHVAYAMLGTLGVMLLLSIAMLLQSFSMTRQIANAQQQEQSLSQQLANITASIDGGIKSEIEELQQQIAKNRQILQSLQSTGLSGQRGFAEHFAGLGRQYLNGLWLNHIRFAEGGEQVTLAGLMNKPTLLPEYLQALRNEQVFQGLHFDAMRIENVEDSIGQLRFEVAVVSDETAGSGVDES